MKKGLLKLIIFHSIPSSIKFWRTYFGEMWKLHPIKKLRNFQKKVKQFSNSITAFVKKEGVRDIFLKMKGIWKNLPISENFKFEQPWPRFASESPYFILLDDSGFSKGVLQIFNY